MKTKEEILSARIGTYGFTKLELSKPIICPIEALDAMQEYSDQTTKPLIEKISSLEASLLDVTRKSCARVDELKDEIADLKSQLLISEQKVKLNYNCAVEFDAKLKASKSEANEADYTEEQVNELIETICFRLRSGHFKTLDLKISAINRIKNEDYKHWKTTLNKTRNNK